MFLRHYFLEETSGSLCGWQVIDREYNAVLIMKTLTKKKEKEKDEKSK